MKNFYIILVVLCFTILNLNTTAQAYVGYDRNYKTDSSIISFVDNIRRDKQTGNFIVNPNPELNVLHIVYDKYGTLLQLGNKSIKWKNNIITQIGNDCVTYLNDKIYTIGGKCVEFDKTGNFVTKIGDLSVEEYFTGRSLPESEYREIYHAPRAMIFNLCSDGTAFSSVFFGVILEFE